MVPRPRYVQRVSPSNPRSGGRARDEGTSKPSASGSRKTGRAPLSMPSYRRLCSPDVTATSFLSELTVRLNSWLRDRKVSYERATACGAD
jgi:hypothetical protein